MGRKRRGRALDGVLLLDKPQGITSFTAVNRARKALDAAKAGHTGTLDPMATGLMQICFGRATRLAQFLTALDKRYEATVALGTTTTTDDAEGEVLEQAAPGWVDAIDRAAVEAALEPLRGVIEQRPPAYSAIKIDGERAYARARRGEAVEVPTRTVTVYELAITDFEPGQVSLRVHCSKGTYVRSLAADLGRALGVGAHLAGLRRTAIGDAWLEGAVPLATLEEAPASIRLASLAEATAHLPTVELDDEGRAALRAGRPVPAVDFAGPVARALTAEGDLLAIVRREGDLLRVARGFQG